MAREPESKMDARQFFYHPEANNILNPYMDEHAWRLLRAAFGHPVSVQCLRLAALMYGTAPLLDKYVGDDLAEENCYHAFSSRESYDWFSSRVSSRMMGKQVKDLDPADIHPDILGDVLRDHPAPVGKYMSQYSCDWSRITKEHAEEIIHVVGVTPIESFIPWDDLREVHVDNVTDANAGVRVNLLGKVEFKLISHLLPVNHNFTGWAVHDIKDKDETIEYILRAPASRNTRVMDILRESPNQLDIFTRIKRLYPAAVAELTWDICRNVWCIPLADIISVNSPAPTTADWGRLASSTARMREAYVYYPRECVAFTKKVLAKHPGNLGFLLEVGERWDGSSEELRHYTYLPSVAKIAAYYHYDEAAATAARGLAALWRGQQPTIIGYLGLGFRAGRRWISEVIAGGHQAEIDYALDLMADPKARKVLYAKFM